MDSQSYDKYSGKFDLNIYTEPVKKCHQIIKNFIIQKYSHNINTLIDIGSGRGHDYEAWLKANIKKVIGIEPSESSIKSAIRKYAKMQNKIPKIIYIRAIGNEKWQNGTGGLDPSAKERLKNIFHGGSVNADRIHMFWTIHYCMDTKKDFLNLFYNINTNLKIGGQLIILSMNGQLIHRLLKKHNGSYKNINDNGNILFELNGYYDYHTNDHKPYGLTIGVKLAGTYGLDTEIKENLVTNKFLINFFTKRKYKLIEKNNFLTFALENNISCINDYSIYQKRISAFYDVLVFEKL